MRGHFGKYEPIIEALKKKYEQAVRAKAMMSLERDKLRAMVFLLNLEYLGGCSSDCTWNIKHERRDVG